MKRVARALWTVLYIQYVRPDSCRTHLMPGLHCAVSSLAVPLAHHAPSQQSERAAEDLLVPSFFFFFFVAVLGRLIFHRQMPKDPLSAAEKAETTPEREKKQRKRGRGDVCRMVCAGCSPSLLPTPNAAPMSYPLLIFDRARHAREWGPKYHKNKDENGLCGLRPPIVCCLAQPREERFLPHTCAAPWCP